MGKWCLHACVFIFDRIIIKVAGNQDRHKSSVEFDFGPNQTTHFGVTCPWVRKISYFWIWIPLKPVGQSWSNFMCSIIGVGERLHKVLGQIDLGTLDSGERSLPFGLLVIKYPPYRSVSLLSIAVKLTLKLIRRAFKDNLGIIFVISSWKLGYSFELPRRADSNECPQNTFSWRTRETYPSIITKYPHLFHCVWTV